MSQTCLFMFAGNHGKPFSDLNNCILPPFYDDVVIKGATFSEHYQNVSSVFTRIWESGFTLNTPECKFFENTLPYLGHIIDYGQICLDPSHVEAIINLPPLKNPKTLKEFLRVAQFCDCFVSQYSLTAVSLHDLTKPDAVYHWSSECQNAFDSIKKLLTTAPV